MSETILGASINQELLDIEGYNCVRQDKRSNSGGLLMYISKDIPYSQSSINICNNDFECITVELNVGKEKISLVGAYKNPKMDAVLFKHIFENIRETILDSKDHIIIIGDLNFNMANENILTKVMPAYNLTNIIKEATCFKSNEPTIIDIMLVTKRRKFVKSFSQNTGISDFHNLVGGILRIHKPPPKQKKIVVRNLAKINYDKVLSDIEQLNLEHMISHCNNANMAYDILQQNLCAILNKHAPKKVKIIKRNSFHCMSKELRKEITKRNRLRNKYYKSRLSQDLSLYKTQRNLVNEIKKFAVNNYFKEKCKAGTRNKDFWKAIKPFFSKYRTKADSIPLREKDELITDDQTVCNIFNTYFKNIGSEIGQTENNNRPITEIILQNKEHESIRLIRNKITKTKPTNFTFRYVSEKDVLKIIKSLSIKKASGYDELPPKFIKLTVSKILKALTMVINRSILESIVPNGMKLANITPLFKKKDKLSKDNYKSVNLLPVLSKVLERIMYNQIYEHMTRFFHPYLSGFRKNHSCQDILIRMIEDWREALDNRLDVGVIAIDLSKAFDCMPHGLLLGKLSAYGFDHTSCQMMKSYLINRQQRVKMRCFFL